MKTNILVLLFFSVFSVESAYAGGPVNVKPVGTEAIHPGAQFINRNDWNFVENKGQHPNSDVKYYGHSNGVYLYCKQGVISFVFTKVEKENDDKISEATACPVETGCIPSLQLRHRPSPSKETTSRTDLVLLNSNPNAQIIASDQQAYYENYYTTTEQSGQAGDANHGITNVYTYKTITYKNIYPYIDMVLNPRSQGMEYSFVVHPGGKISDIQMQWNGIENMEMAKDGGIEYALALGKMDEGKPVSFQGGNKITSSFIKKSTKTGFKVNSYDKGKDLVIDPTLSWATYYGGNAGNAGYGIATDGSGNVYITGNTHSDSGVATTGAYQTSLAGYSDAFLAKFNASGTLQWATYYGGNGDDAGFGIGADSSGNVYITGYTESNSKIATSGAYLTSYAGAGTLFLAKFNGSGTLQWATYYKGGYGSGAYADNRVAIDRSGNVYITGSTKSSSGVATSGAYQTSFGGGPYDAFLAKFNDSGKLQWATYYGGSGDDSGDGVATDGLGNVYITGNTGSDSGIATSGGYQTSFGGVYRTYLAKFDGGGILQWATYYGGGNADIGYGVATDNSGNVYITGYTNSDSGIATTGAYQTSFAGATDAYLAKFNGNGSLQWATYYGGSDSEFGYGVAADGSGNVYITGQTSSSIGIATNGTYQTSYGGGIADAYLAKFNAIGTLQWSTYYGGTGDDEGYGVATDRSGNVYITGYTESSSGIAPSGAYQSSLVGVQDAFITKFPSTNNGIEGDVAQLFNLSLFPNPFSSSITIQYTLLKPSNVNIAIYDITGKQIGIIENSTESKGTYSLNFNTEKYHLTPGLYLLKLMIDDGYVSKQIVKAITN